MKKVLKVAGLASLGLSMALSMASCSGRDACAADLCSAQERQMTLGVVQKEVYKGMSEAQVVTALGSPNIVTKDSDGCDTWVYDKIATEASYQNRQSGLEAGMGVFAPILILGGIGTESKKNSGVSSSHQRTLTVVIKFNERHAVENFSYHTSTF